MTQGWIIGVAAGVAAGVTLLVLLLLCYIRYSGRRQRGGKSGSAGSAGTGDGGADFEVAMKKQRPQQQATARLDEDQLLRQGQTVRRP